MVLDRAVVLVVARLKYSIAAEENRRMPHRPTAQQPNDDLLVSQRKAELMAFQNTVTPEPANLRAEDRDMRTRACLQRVADWGSPAHVGEMRRLDVTDAQW